MLNLVVNGETPAWYGPDAKKTPRARHPEIPTTEPSRNWDRFSPTLRVIGVGRGIHRGQLLPNRRERLARLAALRAELAEHRTGAWVVELAIAMRGFARRTGCLEIPAGE